MCRFLCGYMHVYFVWVYVYCTNVLSTVSLWRLNIRLFLPSSTTACHWCTCFWYASLTLKTWHCQSLNAGSPGVQEGFSHILYWILDPWHSASSWPGLGKIKIIIKLNLVVCTWLAWFTLLLVPSHLYLWN